MNTRKHFLLVGTLVVLLNGYWPAQAQQRLQAVIQRAADNGAEGASFPAP